MKSLVRYLLAGVISAFASVSALAGESSTASILMAPQLQVAGNGPITATFLGASQPFAGIFFAARIPGASDFGRPGSVARFQIFTSNTAFPGFGAKPGDQFRIDTANLFPLPPGAPVTFATLFGPLPVSTSASLFSSTAATPNVVSGLTGTGFGPLPIIFNAGVIETGQDRVMVGFSPSGSIPRGFGGFPIRISLSNVCVR